MAPRRVPERLFWELFPRSVFSMIFATRLAKKTQHRKNANPWKHTFSLGKTMIFKVRQIKKKTRTRKKTATKIIVFLLFFGPKTTSKAIPNSNGTENRRKSHPAPVPNALFRPRVRFLAILGSQMGGKFHEKCVRKGDRKKCWKKIDSMRWVGVMCWASGEVRRGHTSYDSLRRDPDLNPDQSYLARRGDLLRRAADFQAYGSCRPPLGLWDLRFLDLRFESSGLKIWGLKISGLRFSSFVRLESWEFGCRDLSFEQATISLQDRFPAPPVLLFSRLQDSCPVSWFCSFQILLPARLPSPFPSPFPPLSPLPDLALRGFERFWVGFERFWDGFEVFSASELVLRAFEVF